MTFPKTTTALLATTLLATPGFAQNPLGNGGGANPLDRGGSNNPLDHGQGGGNPLDNGGHGNNLGNTPAPAGFVAFNPHTLKDPGMDNMDAFTMLVPDGWRVNGGVRWKPTEIEFAQLVLSMVGPRGEEVALLPSQMYEYTEIDMGQLPGMPPQQPPQLPRLGSRSREGKIFLPVPNSTSEYLLDTYFPANRPAARNVRIIEMTPMTQMRQQLEQQFRPMMNNARQTGQQLQQMAQMSGGQYFTDNGLFADLFKVQYVENGQSFIELIPVAGFWQADENRMMNTGIDQFGNLVQTPGMRTLQQNWWVAAGQGYRAPADTFAQAKPMMVNAALSVKPTPHYQAKMIALAQKIAAIRHKGHMDRMKHQQAMHELRMKTNREIFEMHQDSVRRADEARSRQNEQFIAYIRDEEISVGPDGKRYTHPQGSKLFQGPGGQIGYGPEGGEPPSGWTPYNP
ncbi:MAG: hypothetical protein AAGD32_03460 [Planctomycetota bacterium]